MTGALRRVRMFSPDRQSQFVESINYCYDAAGERRNEKTASVTGQQGGEWSLQDLLLYNVWPCSKTGRFYYHVRYSDIKCWIFIL